MPQFILISNLHLYQSCACQSWRPTPNCLTTSWQLRKVGDVMSCEDFSSLQMLLRVTAYILRAVNRIKAKGKSDSNLPITLIHQEIETLDHSCTEAAGLPEGFWSPDISTWPIPQWQRIVEMWRPVTECQHSLYCQASSSAAQKVSLNCPRSLWCTSTCESQWSNKHSYRQKFDEGTGS